MTENNQYQYEATTYDAPAPEVSKSARVKGIIGMILGILGLCTFYGGGVIYSIVGLILSGMGAKGGEKKFSKIGKITSLIGLILGIIAVIVWVIIFVVAVFANM